MANPVMPRGIDITSDWQEGDEVAALTEQHQLRAIVRRKRSAWYPYRVFPLRESELGYDE